MADTPNIQLGERNYESLFRILQAWRRSAGRSDTIAGEFNRFDNPATLYFRIFFDFTKGLLGPVSDMFKDGVPDTDELWKSTRAPISGSALNYLLLNNEWERADALRDFINLLSNININSPWYFSQIEGIGDVLERPEFGDAFAIPEVKQISIKCLPDAYDNRIGTLLDLYREACYSWQLHKEIIPANLRRFDMYIYIFSKPIRGIHAKHILNDDHIATPNLGDNRGSAVHGVGATLGERIEPTEFATYDQSGLQVNNETGEVEYRGNRYLTSSKLIQLLDCEFDMNAVKSGYGGLNNEDGFQQMYTIPIKVNIAREQRYNELLLKRLGDFVVGDMDLPGSNDESQGKLRPSITNETAANNALSVTPADDRLDNDALSTGQVTPRKNVPQVYYDRVYPTTVHRKDPDSLGARAAALAEPWVAMGRRKLGDLERQATQVFQAGKSALDSWTNINNLNRSLARGVESQVNQLVWGNIFEMTVQDISSKASGVLSGFSSDNVFENSVNGWVHSQTDRGDNPSSSMGGNLGDSSNPPNPPEPVSGNLRDTR